MQSEGCGLWYTSEAFLSSGCAGHRACTAGCWRGFRTPLLPCQWLRHSLPAMPLSLSACEQHPSALEGDAGCQHEHQQR